MNAKGPLTLAIDVRLIPTLITNASTIAAVNRVELVYTPSRANNDISKITHGQYPSRYNTPPTTNIQISAPQAMIIAASFIRSDGCFDFGKLSWSWPIM